MRAAAAAHTVMRSAIAAAHTVMHSAIAAAAAAGESGRGSRSVPGVAQCAAAGMFVEAYKASAGATWIMKPVGRAQVM